MTAEEKEAIFRYGQMTADDWAWVLLPVLAIGFFGWLLGLGVRKVVDPGPVVHSLPVLLGCAGGALGIVGSIFAHRMFEKTRRESRVDIATGEVEVIEVESPTVVQQEETGDEGPIYYFDIGDGKLLFLWGQWLYDPHVYRVGDRSFVDEMEFESIADIPDEPDEPPFPNSHFRIHRATHLGHVLSIELFGERLAPDRIIPASAVRLVAVPPSCILRGSLSNLQDAIASA
jgi:hypothetical protein